MRSIRLLIALVLVMGLIAATGCSSGSLTDPGLERIAEGNNGPGGGPGPNGPGGPNGPWGDFEADCIRYFDVEYDITLPNEKELEATGRITIFDADCSVDESDVMVKFVIQREDMPHPVCKRVIPGTKTLTDEGYLYTGEISREKSGMHHGFETVVDFELLVPNKNDVDEDTIIEGWVHRNRSDWWVLPNDQEKEKERDWHTDIMGIEVFPED